MVGTGLRQLLFCLYTDMPKLRVSLSSGTCLIAKQRVAVKITILWSTGGLYIPAAKYVL